MKKIARVVALLFCLCGFAASAGGDTFSDVDAPDVFVFEGAAVAPAAPAAASSGGAQSAPYSDRDDGSFWAMTPGETDDAVIWRVMTQPITVYDGGLDPTEHAYAMENPDGTGKKVAQIHGQSQGLHVVGETNEYGYVQVEVFSNYDREYFPDTTEEFAAAYDLKTGYVKASALKTVTPRQDMGLLIDKLTQRMYLFIEGKRVTELKISTGLVEDIDEALCETITGEFVTVSHTGTLRDSSKYPMLCDYAIRFNGGILVHEVPHKQRADGSSDFSLYEPLLGSEASHGCVRVQRAMTPEGYNHKWIWDNFERGAPYKVLVWDEFHRADTPVTWQN